METNSQNRSSSVPEPVRPQPRISTAIPIYNEESVLPELLRRVGAVLESIPGGPHEMVFADDGSTDRSLAILQQAAQSDPRIVAISLSRNFGHQSALGAALDYTTGDVIVILDGDLQDDPELIPKFLAEYNTGYDVVYAIRAKRKEGPLKRICYSAFYRIIDSVADLRLPRGSGDFALLSRRVVDLIRLSPERHRYLRGLRT